MGRVGANASGGLRTNPNVVKREAVLSLHTMMPKANSTMCEERSELISHRLQSPGRHSPSRRKSHHVMGSFIVRTPQMASLSFDRVRAGPGSPILGSRWAAVAVSASVRILRRRVGRMWRQCDGSGCGCALAFLSTRASSHISSEVFQEVGLLIFCVVKGNQTRNKIEEIRLFN
jgi:hypothetical protein